MTVRMRTTTAMATTRMMVIATKTENECNDGFDADSATLL